MNRDLEEEINNIYKYRRNLFRKENKSMQRFKSPVFWTQLVLLIAEVIKLCGGYEISNEILNSIQDIITLAFQVFAGLNNPTDKNNF